jgi:hypothetical protein
LYNEDMIHKSLDALWKYNFVPNMGEFRKSLPEKLAGRPYAIDNDMGLVICTWPKGGKRSDWEKHWQFGYFNECMTGFEYEVAGHMIWEGKLKEGLAITRAIHDRYHASKRNPYNEVECSDLYARAMASYGVYTAICGFKYHGPKKALAFAPKLHAEDFQAGFVAAEGWGTYIQKQKNSEQTASVEMASGKLILETFSVNIPERKRIRNVIVKLNGKRIRNSHQVRDSKTIVLRFRELMIKEKDTLTVSMKYV